MDDTKKQYHTEAVYRKQKPRRQTSKAFFKNPHRFLKRLFVTGKSGELEAMVKDVQETYTDAHKDEELQNGDDLI